MSSKLKDASENEELFGTTCLQSIVWKVIGMRDVYLQTQAMIPRSNANKPLTALIRDRGVLRAPNWTWDGKFSTDISIFSIEFDLRKNERKSHG